MEDEKNTLKVDFHMHSYYSDGMFSPFELVQKYKREGYDMIALTDHDAVTGLGEFAEAAEAFGIHAITGIEFDTSHNGTTLHILGYGIDRKNRAIRKKSEELLDRRRDRNERLSKALKELGYEIDMRALERASMSGYVGKPNIARELKRRGFIEDTKKAFEKGGVFELPEIKAVEKEKLSSGEAIKLIENAGGLAVLAHPGKIRELENYREDLENIIKELKEIGLCGLECYYPVHTEEQTEMYLMLAEKYGLFTTRGSDFHEERK